MDLTLINRLHAIETRLEELERLVQDHGERLDISDELGNEVEITLHKLDPSFTSPAVEMMKRRETVGGRHQGQNEKKKKEKKKSIDEDSSASKMFFVVIDSTLPDGMDEHVESLVLDFVENKAWMENLTPERYVTENIELENRNSFETIAQTENNDVGALLLVVSDETFEKPKGMFQKLINEMGKRGLAGRVIVVVLDTRGKKNYFSYRRERIPGLDKPPVAFFFEKVGPGTYEEKSSLSEQSEREMKERIKLLQYEN